MKQGSCWRRCSILEPWCDSARQEGGSQDIQVAVRVGSSSSSGSQGERVKQRVWEGSEVVFKAKGIADKGLEIKSGVRASVA